MRPDGICLVRPNSGLVKLCIFLNPNQWWTSGLYACITTANRYEKILWPFERRLISFNVRHTNYICSSTNNGWPYRCIVCLLISVHSSRSLRRDDYTYLLKCVLMVVDLVACVQCVCGRFTIHRYWWRLFNYLVDNDVNIQKKTDLFYLQTRIMNEWMNEWMDESLNEWMNG